MNKKNKKEDYSLIYLIMTEMESMFLFRSLKIIKTIKSLQNGNFNKNIDSFVILSTIVLELLLKTYMASKICLEYDKKKDNKNIKEIINKKFRKINHNLIDLLNDNELKKKLMVDKVEKFSNGYIDEYRIWLKNNNLISFKTSESSRYTIFSTNKDVAVFINSREIINFLDTLYIIVEKEFFNISSLIKKII